MKEFLATKALPILLGIAFIAVGVFAIAQTISKNKIEKELLSTQNELSEAIGTVEVSDGVYSRLASQHEDLNNRYENLLGQNESLSETLNRKEESIRTLMQANATLREEIEFSGNATTTVIAGCDDAPSESVTVDNGTTTTNPGNPIEEDEFVPNLRVDFDLERSGFRVQGFTESNPRMTLGPPVGRAELTLTQIDPFVIDIAVTENDDNQWRAVIYEQQQRLEFDVGTLAVNPRSSRIRWYERIGFGSQLVATNQGFGFAPTLGLRLGSRGAWSVTAGPHWSFNQDGLDRGATIGFTVYPFSRRRDR